MGTLSLNIRGSDITVETEKTPNDLIHWTMVKDGLWENFTFDCVEKYVDNKTQFVDIGAHIGMVTLFASGKAYKVYAVEPDPIACSSLIKNIEINSLNNVHVLSGAVSPNKIVYLSSHEFGNSMTNILGGGLSTIEVASVDFGTLMLKTDDSKKCFVKIDIEGSEELIVDQVIEYIAERKIFMLISLHQHLKHVSTNYRNRISRLLYAFDYVEDINGSMSVDEIIAKTSENSVLCIKD